MGGDCPMNRPRPWLPLDVAFLDQDTIRTLGERFGAAGPLAIIALIAEASAAIPTKTKGNFDLVESRYAALARRVYIDTDEAKAIVQMAAELDLVDVIESDARRYKLRLLKWDKWHPKRPDSGSSQGQAAR
jgi:hypothetical protein